MNKFAAIAELDELKDHIDEVIEEITQGEYDPDGTLSYEIALCHLQEHLARAWHFAKLSDDKLGDLSNEAFHKASISIPKLNQDMMLVDPEKKII